MFPAARIIFAASAEVGNPAAMANFHESHGVPVASKLLNCVSQHLAQL